MKKSMMVLLCIAMAGMVLGGCAMRSASGTTATAAPIATGSPMATDRMNAATIAPDMSPDMNAGGAAGMQAGNTAGTQAGNTAGAQAGAGSGTDSGMANGMNTVSGMTPAQADRLAENIAEAVERLSEVDDAEVIVRDERVLVAVEFDDQYSVGLDDRMKEMIREAVQKVDDGLTDIEITDDSTLYGQVKSLGDRLAKATGLDELADDFGDLWNRITGM